MHIISTRIIVVGNFIECVSVVHDFIIRLYFIFSIFKYFRSTAIWAAWILVAGSLIVFWGGKWFIRGAFPRGINPSRYLTSNHLGICSILRSSFNVYREFSRCEILVAGDLSIHWAEFVVGGEPFKGEQTPVSISPRITWVVNRIWARVSGCFFATSPEVAFSFL